MASELRAGNARYFRSSKPGPRSAPEADRVRDHVLALRAQDPSTVIDLYGTWAAARADAFPDD